MHLRNHGAAHRLNWECDFHPKSKEYSRKVSHSIPRRGAFPPLASPWPRSRAHPSECGRLLDPNAHPSDRPLAGPGARVQHQVHVGQQERCSGAEFWWPCPISRCPRRSRWFAFRERHILAPRLCGMFRAGDLREGVRAGALAAHSGGAAYGRAPSR